MKTTPKTNKLTRAKMREPYLYIGPSIVVLLLAFGYPLIKNIIMAFQNVNMTTMDSPEFVGLENFQKIFTDSYIGMITLNSVIYVVSSVLGQFLLGLTLALALRRPFKGRGIYQSIVFLPWAFSSFVVGLIFRWSFNGEYGVVNDLLIKSGIMGFLSDRGIVDGSISWLSTPGLSLLVVIVAMIWMGIPFFAIMYLAALQSIPKEIYESAETDGCGRIRSFFAITLPFIKPTIIISLLLRTIWIFNSFDLIVIITQGGPASTSQTLPSYMYSKAFSTYDLSSAAALGLFLMVILLVYSVFFLKISNYNKAGDF